MSSITDFILECLKVAKEGGSVGLFVEGNRAYNDFQFYIDPSITKMIRKMGLENPQVVFYQELTPGFTFFNCYGSCAHTVDYTQIHVPKVESNVMDMHQCDEYIKENIGRKLVLVGASTGTDAHTVGIDAIMNMKGYAGHYGLERYDMIDAYNLGSQVPNEEFLAKAVELGADALLVSQTVTQKDVHIQNLTELVELMEAEGLRDRIIGRYTVGDVVDSHTGELIVPANTMIIEDMANEPPALQPEIPDFIQKLFEEAVRMQTRNELLERQCEQLIAELRDSKDKNESFLQELHKSKEFNDTLAAELKISRNQNEHLITELRETRKELKEAINGIDTMKNQVSMIISQYSTPQHPAFPMTVNDDGSIQFVIHDVIGHDGKSKKKSVDQFYALVPQGLIRGGRPGVTDEIVKQAVEAFKKKK